MRADGQGCAAQSEGVDDRRIDAAGQHHGDIHPGRREFVVQRFAEVEHVRLGRAVVGHVRQSLEGAQRGGQHDAAAAPGDEPAGEGVHQVQVRDGVEGEPAVQVIQRLVQQRTGAGRAGIGDQKPDVEVVGRGQEGCSSGRVAEADGHGPVADAVEAGQAWPRASSLPAERAARTRFRPAAARWSAKAFRATGRP